MFRARAIPGMLPNWPATPLPPNADVRSALTSADGGPPPTAWQPVLPGGYSVVITTVDIRYSFLGASAPTRQQQAAKRFRVRGN
jgi:hypothetical protein